MYFSLPMRGAAYRKREAFLSSVILHLLLIIFILVSPKLFPRSVARKTNADLAAEKQDLGFLALPKDYQKLLPKPKTLRFAEKDRIAQGKAPKIDPKGFFKPLIPKATRRIWNSRLLLASSASSTTSGSAAPELAVAATSPTSPGEQAGC